MRLCFPGLLSRATAWLLLMTGLLAAPRLFAQYGPDNPDPDGNYITRFEFSQSVPALTGTYDPARRLPGRDTYLMIPDRTGMLTISLDLTFTHSALDVSVTDATGAVIGGASSTTSGTPVVVGIPVSQHYPPFHVIIKKPSGGGTVAVKTIVIPDHANSPSTPSFIGGGGSGGYGGGGISTSPPNRLNLFSSPTTNEGNESEGSGENYGSCGSCEGSCPTPTPPTTTTEDEADMSANTISGTTEPGLSHNTQSAGTSAGGMSTTNLGFDVNPAASITRADFMATGSGDATITRDGGGITSITTGSLYTKVETVTTPVAGVLVSQWRTFALSSSTPALRTSFYWPSGTYEMTKTTTIGGHSVDTVWRYNPSAVPPNMELVMGNGLRKKQISLESNGGDTTIRRERQKLYERAAGASGTAAVLVSDVIVTYKRHSFGWKKIKQEVLGLTGNPLTTTWEYWGSSDVTGSSGSTGGQGLLKKIARPDGWTCEYSYSHAGGVFERIATSPYQGTAGGRVEVVVTDFGSGWRNRSVNLSGVLAESNATYISGNVITQIDITSAVSSLGSSTTISPLGSDFGGMPTEILYSDSTALIASYSRAPDGSTSITWDRGELSGSSIVDGTSTTLSTDAAGFRSALIKSDIVSSVTLEQAAVTDTDDWGRPEEIEYFGDPSLTDTYTYNCCGLASHADRTGLVTSYAHDDVHRLVKTHSAGVSRQTVYDGLEVRSYRFAEGSMSSPTNPSNDDYLISRSSRDLSGTVVERGGRSPASGNMITMSTTTTVHRNPEATSPNPGSLAAGIGTKVTRVLDGTPDDTATPQEETLSYLDGAAYQTTGNLGTNLRYSYGRILYDTDWDTTAETDALTFTTTRLDGGTEKESSVRITDWLGRTVESSGFGEGATRFKYGWLGQLETSVDADGVTHLFGYNNLGDRVLTTLDLDQDGTVDYGSDTVTFTETRPDSSGPADVIRTISKVWQPSAGSGSPTVVSHSDRTPDGLESAAERFPAIGGISSSSVTVLAGGGDWMVSTTNEDGTISTGYYEDGRRMAEAMWEAGSSPPATAPADITDVSTAGFISGTAYTYDDFGRLEVTIDSRTGPVTTAYVSDTCDYVANVSDAGSRVTAYTYDDRGRRKSVNLPDTASSGSITLDLTNVTTTTHYEDGSVKLVDGGQAYKTAYTYDYARRMETLTTYGDTTATTIWNYDATGRLESKTYPDGPDVGGTPDPGPSYTYTTAGRLKKRIWARGNTTRYDYDAGGRLAYTRYFTSATSQGTVDGASTGNDPVTPDSAFTRDALGRMDSASNVYSSITYDYDPDDLGLETETISIDPDGSLDPDDGGPLVSRSSVTRTLVRERDSLLRPYGYEFKDGGTVEAAVNYFWDSDDGRLATVWGDHGGVKTFDFYYQENSFNLQSSIFGPAHFTFFNWMPDRDLLDNRADYTFTSSSEVQYTVNALGQRTEVLQMGDEFPPAGNEVIWGYDSKGQVVTADRSENGFAVSTGDRGYTYDGIGNRYRSSRDSTDPSSATGSDLATYYSDSAGTTEGANALNQYLNVDLYGASATVQVYDEDGNQTDGPFPNGSDGDRWWDGENRMYRSQIASTDTYYAQDPFGRRVAKFQGGGSGMTGTVYFYDGWNVAAECSITSSTYPLSRTYTWGPDLSGTFQGAGGVGGLLAVEIETGTDAGVYYPTFDGNGNVSEYMDENGAIVAHFEYDPFGEEVVASGAKAGLFNYRFSTKPLDVDTGLYYYGYRYYDPVTGRWPSRDPIGEKGGLNLYGFISNTPISSIDFMGLAVGDCYQSPRLAMMAALDEAAILSLQNGWENCGWILKSDSPCDKCYTYTEPGNNLQNEPFIQRRSNELRAGGMSEVDIEGYIQIKKISRCWNGAKPDDALMNYHTHGLPDDDPHDSGEEWFSEYDYNVYNAGQVDGGLATAEGRIAEYDRESAVPSVWDGVRYYDPRTGGWSKPNFSNAVPNVEPALPLQNPIPTSGPSSP